MEGREEGEYNYTYRHTVTTRRSQLYHNLFEEKGQPKWIRTEVLLLTSLTPHRWAKPAHFIIIIIIIIMYIHRALINALSAHIIDINLDMIFYTQDIYSIHKIFYTHDMIFYTHSILYTGYSIHGIYNIHRIFYTQDIHMIFYTQDILYTG